MPQRSPPATPVFWYPSLSRSHVHKANLQSASYSLRASLAMPDAIRAWKIDSLALATGRDQLIAIEQPYAVANPHTLLVSGRAAGPVNFGNVIHFMIVAN